MGALRVSLRASRGFKGVVPLASVGALRVSLRAPRGFKGVVPLASVGALPCVVARAAGVQGGRPPCFYQMSAAHRGVCLALARSPVDEVDVAVVVVVVVADRRDL